jgi:hypothetical protein
MASGPDAAIALVVAIAIRTQATAAAHNSRDDQFCFTVFSTEIMTLSFRGSDFLLHCDWVLCAQTACPVAALIIALLQLPGAFKIRMKHYYAHLSGIMNVKLWLLNDQVKLMLFSLGPQLQRA